MEVYVGMIETSVIFRSTTLSNSKTTLLNLPDLRNYMFHIQKIPNTNHINNIYAI